MTEPSHAVFLSYASQDAEAAQRICEALRAAGIEVWFDQSELRGGDAWDQSIRKQIKTCALFLPVISHTTHDRREGYFRLEWKLAVDRCHLMDANLTFLLPVVIDDTRDDDERVPERFREVQWTRLPAGETPPAFVERVQRLLSGDLKATDTKATAPVSSSVPFVKRSPRPKILSPFPLLIAAVLAAGVVYWAVGRYHSSKSGVVTAIPEKSIAVLPFVDMSEKKDQEYFSDGLSEELIDHLAHAVGLKVVARTSSFQFKGRNEDVRSIALKLGVAHLLEGSVRAAGHEMRITAQLIRASDGTHLWSQTYDRQISDIFKVQDEIAEKVAQALSIALSGGVARPDGNEKNPAAYDLLLKGNFFYARSHEGDRAHAVDCYLQALALDPNYALAWAKLARSYIRQAGGPGYPRSTMEQKARDALRHALDIDPNSAVAHRWLGRIYLNFEWNWALAAGELARAVALDPAGPEGTLAQGDLDVLTALTTGQFDDGIQRAVAEQANNPLDPNALWFLSWFPELDGRHEQAAAYQKQLLDLDPDYGGAHGFAAATALAMGKTADALAEAEKEPDEGDRLAILARVYWKLGRSADANRALEQLESKFANDAAYDIAVVYASRGDADAALTWLERAYRQHDGGMVLLKVDSRLAGLRGQPRYHALMRQMQLNP